MVGLNKELRQVLAACYHYYRPTPSDDRSICYRWIKGTYKGMFGESFSRTSWNKLVKLEYLTPGESSRGGHRRYYTLANPEIIADILSKWGIESD